MSKKSLILTLVADQPYLHTADNTLDFKAKDEILFSAISYTYLPLLNMFGRLEDENIPFKMGLVLSANICTLLDDPQVQKKYIDHLDRQIELGTKEIERNKDNPELLRNSQECLDKAKKDKYDFTEVYGQNILDKLRYYAKKDKLELTATAASYTYLPHYSDIPEALNAQVETGLYAQRHFFGSVGEGFFLPFQGWAKGFERVLRSYGLNYTILDAKSLLFAENACPTGIFKPVRTANSLVIFGSDCDTKDQIEGEDGYIHNEVYRNQGRDIGFDEESESLKEFMGDCKTRIPTGYKYYALGDPDADDYEDTAYPYEFSKAAEQTKIDALDFYTDKKTKLTKAYDALNGESCNLVCVIPASLIGQEWYEGVAWLENVIRLVAQEDSVTLDLCKNLIENQFTLPKIVPYPCSASGTGYGEDLIESSNSWMLRYARKATERMIDLTERFPSETGLKARLLNLGAKELIMAQSSCWPKMISKGTLPEVASEEFTKQIVSFTTVFDSLASNTVSTEWLTKLEKEHAIFPWINYRVFSRKK